MRVRLLCLMLVFTLAGCSPSYRTDLDYSHTVEQTFVVDSLSSTDELVQFESVELDLAAAFRLETAIVDDGIVQGRKVLHLGAGTGLISLLCAMHGANSVVATDVHAAAIANGRYNAAQLDLGTEPDFRFHSQDHTDAFSAIDAKERFDLILMNIDRSHFDLVEPQPEMLAEKFEQLLVSLFDGLGARLIFGGRLIVISGNQPKITQLKQLVSDRPDLAWKSLDDRLLKDLPEEFSPAMMIEIRIQQTTKPNKKPID